MKLRPYPLNRFHSYLDKHYAVFKEALYECRTESRRCLKGDEILKQGQQVDFLAIVPNGRVSMNIIASNGRRFQLGEVDCDYQIFGEMEFFTETRCQWNIIADEDIDIDMISVKKLEELLIQRPEFTMFFASALSFDYQESLDIYTSRLLHSITYNIAYDLLHRDQNDVLLDAFNTSTLEAERFGTSSRVYRRAIKTLIDKNLVIKDKGNLKIVDTESLVLFLRNFD